jgi:hypothetical protein
MIREQTHLTIKKIVIRIITIEREYGCGAPAAGSCSSSSIDWMAARFLKDDLLYITACTLFQASRIEG